MCERGAGSMAKGGGDTKQIRNCRYKTCSFDTFLERLPTWQRNGNTVGFVSLDISTVKTKSQKWLSMWRFCMQPVIHSRNEQSDICSSYHRTSAHRDLWQTLGASVSAWSYFSWCMCDCVFCGVHLCHIRHEEDDAASIYGGTLSQFFGP